MASSSGGLGDALGGASDAAAAVSGLGSSFEGATADAVKSYWGQVHGCMASALGAALTQLTASYSEYFNELDAIDGSAYARFVQEEVESAQGKASDVGPTFADVDGGVRSALGSVSDIVSVAAPGVDAVTSGLSAIEQETGDLDRQVSAAESDGVAKAAAAAELISSAEGFLAQIEAGSAGGGTSYVPADFFTTQAAAGLLDALEAFSGSPYADGDYVSGRLGQMASAIQGHDQTRFEDAKREAEEQSVLKIVAGVGVAIAGAAAIVATAGAATPVVALAFGAVGGATIVFGAADVAEGVQDAYKSFNARDWDELGTRSFNFVRDTVFNGDEGSYRTVEGVLVTACSLAGPAARGSQALSAAMQGGSRASALLAGGRAAVGDYLRSQALGLADQYVVNPALSALVGGGTAGKLLVGLKDDAMGIRGLAGGLRRPSGTEGHVRVEASAESGEGVGMRVPATDGEAKVGLGVGTPEAVPVPGDEHVRVDTSSVISDVESGRVELGSSIRKGNFVEMKADADYTGAGYTRVSSDSVTSLDAPTHHGIDGVYYMEGRRPPYVIVESKYGTSQLSRLADHKTRQMSDKWIYDRLENAVGKDMAKEIRNAGYSRELYRAAPDGAGGFSVTTRQINSDGYVVRGSAGSVTGGGVG
nr:T7SS effector LXG polymorphic toxin [Olsenella sp. Marseille-P4559]